MIIEMKKQNNKPLTDEEAILKKLRINDIAEITKEGLKKLSSLHIDPEVSKKLIEQIPHFSELAKAVMHDYSLSFQKVLESDTISQSYSDACRSMLEGDDLNSDQKLKILEDMKEIAREKREHDMKLFLIKSVVTVVTVAIAAVPILCCAVSAAAPSSED